MNCDFSNKDNIVGANSIKLYENVGINLTYPDISNLTEISEITNTGFVFEAGLNSNVTWERKTDYSDNYREIFTDIFAFSLFGLEQNTRNNLDKLRAVRTGLIAELHLTDGTILVFPTPIFASKPYEKKEDSKTWLSNLSYRVPTFLNYLIKINLITNCLQFNQSDCILFDNTEPILIH